jgi:hypothetical protein
MTYPVPVPDVLSALTRLMAVTTPEVERAAGSEAGTSTAVVMWVPGVGGSHRARSFITRRIGFITKYVLCPVDCSFLSVSVAITGHVRNAVGRDLTGCPVRPHPSRSGAWLTDTDSEVLEYDSHPACERTY